MGNIHHFDFEVCKRSALIDLPQRLTKYAQRNHKEKQFIHLRAMN